ncbi:MAG: TetR/AcrR family transcriptional regulator [Acidimicrobiales bacterium]|nr:TetR/AcrR family transcriptional regulator [Acidimicrobiales bacterium]RZV43348.1 MAG: TetR/AcrR family transcriptional regulator [Acidimicrobiales bacterium]
MPRVSASTKAEHRERLLSAAAAEFAAKGLDGARVDDISVAAGLAKGTIYNYFDSKADVFRAVIEAWSSRTEEVRGEIDDEAPVEDQLRSILEADMQVTGEIEEFARTAFREVLTASPEELADLLPSWDPVDAEIQRVVENAQAAGELRSDRSSIELTRFLLSLTNGMLLEHWFPDSDLTLEEIPELVLDYYLDGARTR